MLCIFTWAISAFLLLRELITFSIPTIFFYKINNGGKNQKLLIKKLPHSLLKEKNNQNEEESLNQLNVVQKIFSLRWCLGETISIRSRRKIGSPSVAGYLMVHACIIFLACAITIFCLNCHMLLFFYLMRPRPHLQ